MSVYTLITLLFFLVGAVALFAPYLFMNSTTFLPVLTYLFLLLTLIIHNFWCSPLHFSCAYHYAFLSLLGSIDGSVKLYQLSGKRLLQTFIHSKPTSTEDGTPAVMTTISEASGNPSGNGDDEDEEEDVQFEETLAVECVGFSSHDANNKWAASGGMDNTIKIWDLSNGSLRCTCNHSSAVTDLKWHATMPVVFAATINGSITIWDARAGLQLADLCGHRAQITNFSISTIPASTEGENDKEVIITASDDYTSRVFLIDVSSML